VTRCWPTACARGRARRAPTRAWGGFATWALAAEDTLLPLPPGLSFAEAACLLGSYETAWHGLVHRAAVGAGDHVLVLGATGATGLAAVDLAARAGAVVLAVGRSPAKLAAVRGAHHTLTVPPAELPAAVKALTGGRGADVVWDGVGGPWSEAGLRAAAFGARVCVIGWAATPQAGRSQPPNVLPSNLILMKGLTVLGCPAVISAERDPAVRPPRLAGGAGGGGGGAAAARARGGAAGGGAGGAPGEARGGQRGRPRRRASARAELTASSDRAPAVRAACYGGVVTNTFVSLQISHGLAR
jgi:NADPH:quinone reductase-like Zn-dependent oxidoreductase